MKKLYFIRHGESEFNKAHKWAGSVDTPLTQTGHEQAQKAGKELKKQGLAFDIIISSPLERAHQTAKNIATELEYPHVEIILESRLVERNFGSLEGRKDLIAATKYVIDESTIDSIDGVEMLIDLQQRANELLAYLHSLPHQHILVVGHGAMGRALRRAINNEPLHKRGTSYKNAEIVRFI